MAARAVQLVVLAVPIAASVGCAAVVSAALPHAHHLSGALGWWAIVLACSTVTLVAVDRLARRLLPLALLLRLSLLFPDQAPRRFRIAARSWSTRRVRDQMAREQTTDSTTAPMDAAKQIIGLLASLAAHDRRTRGHCERVRAYNDLIAEELGLPESDRDRLRWAALIHDIGKLDVSKRVLNKPGKPTAREWEQLRAHPERGAEIAAPLAEWLGPWSLAIAQHHEHWDGTGYPHGLAGNQISLGARIVGVADAFEVMTSPRPYSKPVSAAAAREELASCAGTHFDPQVVRALLNISLGRLRKSMGAIAWFSQVPLLASMPRLSAALIQGGQQAAAGAGGAIGVVAVSTVPAAATHTHVHEAVHNHPAPVVQSSSATVGPLAAVLALTGHRSNAPQTVAPAKPHGKANANAHGTANAKHRGQAAAQSQGKGAAHGLVGRVGGTTHRSETAATKRHHGQARHHNAATGVTKNVTKNVTTTAAATAGRCGSNSGSGVGNGGGTAGTNTNSHNSQTGVVLPPGLSRCD
ncbi:MAG TPA: HD-GYP domain-containing protein [Mycobacteriales bacterium]|nr:HD-GYP domain-containing protein [Mycobacteriales bacterium]